MLLYRDDEWRFNMSHLYYGLLDMNVAKNRQGKVAQVALMYDETRARFSEWTGAQPQ